MKVYHTLAKIIALLVIFSPLCLRSDDVTGPWIEIADLMKARNYNGAIDKLNGYARESTNPEHKALYYYQIGSVYFEYIQDYNQAMSAFQKVLSLKKSVNSPSPDFEYCIALSQMSSADIYRRTGKYDKAIEEYDNVVKDYPKTIYARIASNYIKGINNALAEIESYRKIVAEQPNTDIAAEIQFEIAELYLSLQNLNNPEQAIEEYTKVIENYPDNPKSIEAQFKIANTYRLDLRKPNESITAYQKIVERGFFANSLRAEAMFQIGIIYYSDLHDYLKASDVFTKFLEEYPIYWKFPAGVYWQGMCYEQLGDYDSAIKSLELFIQLYPDDESKLLADIGRLGERDVKSLIKAKVDELKKIAPKALFDKAELLRSSGKYRESIFAYRELMPKYPDYTQKAKLQTGKIENLAEIQMLQEIITKRIDDAPDAQYRMAEIYETEMNYPHALKEYQAVADNYSGTYWASEALLRMGIIYSGSVNIRLAKAERGANKLAGSDYDKAIATYQQLIKEYPKSYRSAEAHYHLGELYRVRLNDFDKALTEYEKIISDYPKKSFYEREGYKDSLADQAQFKIGKVYYENLKDYDKALKAFTKFLVDYPDSCRKAAVYSFIAAIQEAKKDYVSAITSLETIIDIVTDSNVQSLYFMRDSVSGIKPLENTTSSSDLQSEIVKQIGHKVSQIKAK